MQQLKMTLIEFNLAEKGVNRIVNLRVVFGTVSSRKLIMLLQNWKVTFWQRVIVDLQFFI